MHIEQIIALDDDLKNPQEVDKLEFITPDLCGIWINGELGFSLPRYLYFYGANKTYIEKDSIFNSQQIDFRGKTLQIEEAKNIDLKSLIFA